jgi:hypothetical protein
MLGCWILAGLQCDPRGEQAARRLRRAHKCHILKAGVGLTGPTKLIEESPEQAKARDAIDETLMRE